MNWTLNDSYHVRAGFSDLDAFTESVREWELEFRQPGRGALGCEILQTGCPAGMLSHACFAAGVTQQGIAPGAGRTFALPCSATPIEWCGRRVGPGDLLVFEAGSEFRAASAPGFRVYALSLTEAALLASCARLEVAVPPALRTRAETVVHAPLAARRLVARLGALERSLRALAPRTASGRLSRAFAADLPDAIVAMLASPGERERRPLGALRARSLRRALDAIEERPGALLRVPELSAAAGASERTLGYAFREYLGVTPVDYLRGRRLDGVRRDLERAGPVPGQVTWIAARWGFEHLGQLAIDYRRRFGELPTQTLRR